MSQTARNESDDFDMMNYASLESANDESMVAPDSIEEQWSNVLCVSEKGFKTKEMQKLLNSACPSGNKAVTYRAPHGGYVIAFHAELVNPSMSLAPKDSHELKNGAALDFEIKSGKIEIVFPDATQDAIDIAGSVFRVYCQVDHLVIAEDASHKFELSYKSNENTIGAEIDGLEARIEQAVKAKKAKSGDAAAIKLAVATLFQNYIEQHLDGQGEPISLLSIAKVAGISTSSLPNLVRFAVIPDFSGEKIGTFLVVTYNIKKPDQLAEARKKFQADDAGSLLKDMTAFFPNGNSLIPAGSTTSVVVKTEAIVGAMLAGAADYFHHGSHPNSFFSMNSYLSRPDGSHGSFAGQTWAALKGSVAGNGVDLGAHRYVHRYNIYEGSFSTSPKNQTAMVTGLMIDYEDKKKHGSGIFSYHTTQEVGYGFWPVLKSGKKGEPNVVGFDHRQLWEHHSSGFFLGHLGIVGKILNKITFSGWNYIVSAMSGFPGFNPGLSSTEATKLMTFPGSKSLFQHPVSVVMDGDGLITAYKDE